MHGRPLVVSVALAIAAAVAAVAGVACLTVSVGWTLLASAAVLLLAAMYVSVEPGSNVSRETPAPPASASAPPRLQPTNDMTHRRNRPTSIGPPRDAA